MTLRELAWAGVAGTAGAATPLVARLPGGLGGELVRRASSVRRMTEWAAGGRDPALPLLWLHGASAGELVGAEPVVDELRRRGELQLVVTFTSPSGAAAAARLDPAWSGLVPLDAPAPCGRAIDALLPDALVFARWDVWPGLAASAADRGVGLGLVNATVRPDSSRLRMPARWLLRPAYGRLRRVGAASAADADRLRRLGVRPRALAVTGDAAFDRALARADAPGPAGRELEGWLRAAGPSDLVVVAGSTWPADEDALLAAMAELAAEGVRAAPVIVPHRPSPGAIGRLVGRCRDTLGREPALWSAWRSADGSGPGGRPPAGTRARAGAGASAAAPAALVVDRVGLLADLYGAADVAYVGGGFGPGGLHSVVEAAAAGVPVLFGDRRRRADADRLAAGGGGLLLPRHGLAGALRRLAAAPEERHAMGRRARAHAEAGRGAGRAGADLVDRLLGRGWPARGPSRPPARGGPGPRP